MIIIILSNQIKYEIILSLEYDSSLTRFWSNMFESWEGTYIHMYLCVRVRVCECEEDVHEKRVKKEKLKWKEREKSKEKS